MSHKERGIEAKAHARPPCAASKGGKSAPSQEEGQRQKLTARRRPNNLKPLITSIHDAFTLMETLIEAHTADADDRPEHETYLSTEQLAERVPFTPGTLRNKKSEGHFLEGKHFLKKGRTTIWIWSAIEEWLRLEDNQCQTVTPFTSQKERNGRS